MSGRTLYMMILFLLLLSLFNVCMFHWLGVNPSYYQLNSYTWESADFRSMRLGPAVAALDEIDTGRLAGLMLDYRFDLTGLKGPGDLSGPLGPLDLSEQKNLLLEQKSAAYRKLSRAYEILFSDLVCFPVPASTRKETPPVVYEDGWQQKRTYGGERGHEGCDIMGDTRERGFYPVVSITDGTVEKLGWLEQGGWRVGIRSPSGLYLYYAHLYSYAEGLEAGSRVQAGQLLGYMGDSGYGKQENTVGNFAVHLHLGLYLKTDHYEEMSVNPYWVLKYLEKKKLFYNY